MRKRLLNKLKIFDKGLSFVVIWFAIFLLIGTGCQDSDHTFRIFEKPILFDEYREQLSLRYLEDRHGLEMEKATIVPRMIVVHWTSVRTLEETFDIFNRVLLTDSRSDLKNVSKLNVSAHFLVDRDGTIFRLLPDTVFARHTIGLNYMAIGIENIGGSDAPLTKLQLEANVELIAYLSKRHEIDYVIGHHEYQKFKNSNIWKETDSNYLTDKVDPGIAFMADLRKSLLPLKFKASPD
ncbi:MAG: peptidoglycan recognition family protein [Brumimicrobium sp.]